MIAQHGSRENLPSPHSPRTSALASGAESDRSFCNSPEASSTPIPSRTMSRSDVPSPDLSAGNPDILRELLDRKRSLMMLSFQAPESQVNSRDSFDSFGLNPIIK